MAHPARTALRGTVAGAALAGLISAATPASAVTTPHVIDTDVVKELHTSGTVTGTSWEEVKDGSIQVRVLATLTRAAGVTGCTLARATFTYADGSTSRRVSGVRVCRGEPSAQVTLRSSAAKDVVKYVVENLSATDLTAPADKVSGSTFFVGDYPDSLGTRERLDHDDLRMTFNGRLVLRGSSDYSVQRVPYVGSWYVLDRVTGTLTWPTALDLRGHEYSVLPGTYAYVQVDWTYADGTTGRATSGRVSLAQRSRALNLTSALGKEAIKVRVQVFTSVSRLPAIDTGTKHFGDYRDR